MTLPWSNEKTRFWLVVVITVAWGISFIIDIVNPAYDPPGVVNSLMLLVAGAMFGSEAVSKIKRKVPNGEE